jgi:hypothetical protein
MLKLSEENDSSYQRVGGCVMAAYIAPEGAVKHTHGHTHGHTHEHALSSLFSSNDVFSCMTAPLTVI